MSKELVIRGAALGGARPDVRNAHLLQQALYGAVFPEAPVHYRERDVCVLEEKA